jgi:uncharacterized ion transporter superfamily protein YfcC
MAMSLRVPHTLVLMFAMMIAALVLTWLLPAGSFETELSESGRAMVVPGTFARLDDVAPLPPWAVLTVVPRALADAQAVVFFVLIVGGVIAVLRETGAIDALIGRVLARFSERLGLLVFGTMFVFSVFSASFGMATEYIAFIGILIALSGALRLDTMSAVGIVVVGYGIGYGVALLNPFTVVIAQNVAGLDPGSGMGYRALIAMPLFLIGFHHVYRYARRVQADPASSLVAGLDGALPPPVVDYPPMTLRRGLVLLTCAAALIALIAGISMAQWDLVALGALFLGLGIAAALIAGLPLARTADVFVAGAAQMAGTALLIGFARSIALLLEDGQVLHTVVNAVAMPLALLPPALSAVGMLLIQSVMNFLIPSGSGQALATMPIMAPIADLVGVSRQVAVLAYQFGDGFTNMIVPTNPVLMGILGIAGVPYERWLRFIGPLMIKLLAASAVALVIAVWIGYQ